jgi:hypothetical protein
MSLTKVSSAVLNIDDLYGFRNRIINGDMRIDQRNAGAAVTVNDSDNLRFPVDRTAGIGAPSAGVFTLQQSAVVPAGFNNSIVATVTTASTPSGTQVYNILQNIEGFNVADLGFGTANAQTVTLSFWVRSSLTGTFGGALRNSAVNRSYPFSYTISAANTWEQKSITVPGDTTGTWLTNNLIGIRLNFSLGGGADRLGTAGAWNSNNNTGATGQTNLIVTSGATFYITGVQLEKGTVATPFERRPFGMELALCQRYYEKSYNIDVAPGTVSDVGRVIARNVTADTFGFPSVKVDFKVTKRATPTIVRYSTNDGASGNIYLTSPAGNSTSNMVNDISMSGFNFYTVSNITNLGGLASMQWVSEIEL